MCYNVFSMIRCKNSHPAPKLSLEDVDAITEIEDSINDRSNAFSEMEAFLPKKNGFDFCLLIIYCVGFFSNYYDVEDVSSVNNWHLSLFRLYLTLVLGNVNVTLLNKQSK